jgi:hypothetical protein
MRVGLLRLLTTAYVHQAAKTMSAPTSASGGESGNVTDGPNSTLLTRPGHRRANLL